MQITRHWRLNPQRYRLEGYRYPDGTLSLRSQPCLDEKRLEEEVEQLEEEPVLVLSYAG